MKKLAYSSLYRGQLVALSDLPTAQVYTIAEINREGFLVILQWREGKRFCSQGFDGPLYLPTTEQIEYSIAANGALVSANDIVEWA